MTSKDELRVLIATNAFKGTLTAQQAASHLAGGFKAAAPGARLTILPLADGGDGTLEAFRFAAGGVEVPAIVTGPLGRPVKTSFLMTGGGRAVIEMAKTSGLALAGGVKDPMRATTRGAGELIALAVSAGAREILIGSGGSATMDGGLGALMALGFRFLDAQGRDVPEGGAGLCCAVEVKRPERRPVLPVGVSVRVLCDVKNPLTGKNGAAAVFGPQKGATPGQIETIDEGLARLSALAFETTGMDLSALPGAGSAGGFAFGLAQFLGAELEQGAGKVLSEIGFRRLADCADLVVTGEGRIDGQSAMGKAPGAVVRACRELSVPCAAVCGVLGPGWETLLELGAGAVHSCFGNELPEERLLKVRTPARLSDLGGRIAAGLGARPVWRCWIEPVR